MVQPPQAALPCSPADHEWASTRAQIELGQTHKLAPHFTRSHVCLSKPAQGGLREVTSCDAAAARQILESPPRFAGKTHPGTSLEVQRASQLIKYAAGPHAETGQVPELQREIPTCWTPLVAEFDLARDNGFGNFSTCYTAHNRAHCSCKQGSRYRQVLSW